MARKFPNKWIRPIQWCIVFLFISLVGSFIIFGFFARSKNAVEPNYDRIWGEFFKGPFLIQLIIVVSWFIASIKERPSRFEEFKFLASLPIQPQRIFDIFFLSDLYYFSWVPIILVVLFLGLLPLSSLSFLAGPILLSVVAYLSAMAAMAVVHLFISLKFNRFKSHNYLTKPNPLVQCLVLLGFEGMQIAIILNPFSASKLNILIIVLIQCSFVLILIRLAEKLFIKLHNQNSWSKVSVPRGKAVKITDSLFLKIIGYLSKRSFSNPLLLKNMIRSGRAKSGVSNIISSGVFIAIAYLMAMNNPNLEDGIAVLYVLTVIYILFYCYRLISRMGTDLESTKIIFTLPISTRQFYYSIFWPAIVWTLIIYTSITFLLFIAGSNLYQVSFFWLKSFTASLLLLTIAMNCGLANYPGTKTAQQHFSKWIMALIFAGALLYKYRILIAITITLMSYISLRKVKLFRTHTRHTKPFLIL